MVGKEDLSLKVDQETDPDQEDVLPRRWRAVRLGGGIYLYGLFKLSLALFGLPLYQSNISIGLSLTVVALLGGLGPKLFSWCMRQMGCTCPETGVAPFAVVAAFLFVGGFICLGAGIVISRTPVQELIRQAAPAALPDQKEYVVGDGRFPVQTPESWQPPQHRTETSSSL